MKSLRVIKQLPLRIERAKLLRLRHDAIDREISINGLMNELIDQYLEVREESHGAPGGEHLAS